MIVYQGLVLFSTHLMLTPWLRFFVLQLSNEKNLFASFLLSIESWLFKDGILKLWFMKYIIINPHITGLVEFLRMYTQQATKTGPFFSNCWALALAPWKPVEVINNVSNSHISSPGRDPYLRPQGGPTMGTHEKSFIFGVALTTPIFLGGGWKHLHFLTHGNLGGPRESNFMYV